MKATTPSLLIGDTVYKAITDRLEGNMANYFNRGFSLFCVKCLYSVITINSPQGSSTFLVISVLRIKLSIKKMYLPTRGRC